MDPVAFQLGPLAIRWYGIFVALGFIAGLVVVERRSARAGMRPEQVANLVFVGLIGGLLGARLFYVLHNLSYFGENPWEAIRLDHGGLVFYGGLIGGTLSLVATCLLRRLPMGRVADMLIPGLPLGHALGRIGCFLNGCCFGQPWSGPCGVHYDAGSQAAASQCRQGLIAAPSLAPLPVFPVQLIAVVANVAIFLGLLAIERRLRGRGQLLGLYIAVYGLYRFAIEFLRGDYLDAGMLTPAQEVSVVLIPVGVVVFLLRRGKGETGMAEVEGDA